MNEKDYNIYIFGDAHSYEDWEHLEKQISNIKPNLIMLEFLQNTSLINTDRKFEKEFNKYKNWNIMRYFLKYYYKFNCDIIGIDLEWSWDEETDQNFGYLGDITVFDEEGNFDLKRCFWPSMKIRENHWKEMIEKYRTKYEKIVIIVGDAHLYTVRPENMGGENELVTYYENDPKAKVINLEQRYGKIMPEFKRYWEEKRTFD